MALIHDVHSEISRRRKALRNPIGSGLVVVRCCQCARPIATTKVDQDKGEPPILLDFPENAKGWTCTDCSAVRRQCAWVYCTPVDGQGGGYKEERCRRWFNVGRNRKFCDEHRSQRSR